MKIRILLLLLLLVVDFCLEFYAPEVATLILGVEIVIIFQLINTFNMKHYRTIYDKMDKHEKKLVHKLLGLLAFCLVVPIVKFLYEAFYFVLCWFKIIL